MSPTSRLRSPPEPHSAFQSFCCEGRRTVRTGERELLEDRIPAETFCRSAVLYRLAKATYTKNNTILAYSAALEVLDATEIRSRLSISEAAVSAASKIALLDPPGFIAGRDARVVNEVVAERGELPGEED